MKPRHRRLLAAAAVALATGAMAQPVSTGKVNFASAGSGGSSDLVPEYFKYRTGTFMTHIPYKGSGPAVADVVAGQVQVMFDTLLTSTPLVKSGKLRMLAATTSQRLAAFQRAVQVKWGKVIQAAKGKPE